MKAKIKDKRDASLTLLIEEADPSFANALRRTIISEVPTLAIGYVTFLENSSPIYDEIIAHRLGLVPIKADISLFNFRDACSCKGKGCPSCTLNLTLKKNGPGMIYSQDLKSEDPKMKPRVGIPIVKLAKNHNVSLEAEAVLGISKEHAKWQPAVASYKYYPEIKISADCTQCEECVEACPTNVFSMKNGKVKVTDLEACSLCNTCVDICEAGAVEVKGREDKFIFKIESTGALPPKEVFDKACDILAGKAETLIKLL